MLQSTVMTLSHAINNIKIVIPTRNKSLDNKYTLMNRPKPQKGVHFNSIKKFGVAEAIAAAR